MRIFVEGVVIVGSILLALAADAWWDGRQERIEEREILLGLREELIENQQILGESLILVEEGVAHLREFLRMTPDEVAQIPPDSAYARIVQPHRRVYSASLSLGFLDATVSSGKLALIRDGDLRGEISGIIRLYENALEVLAYCQDLSRDAATALGQHAEVQSFSGGRPEVGPISGSTLRALRDDDELVGLTVAKAGYWAAYVSESSVLESHLDSVIKAINEALE